MEFSCPHAESASMAIAIQLVMVRRRACSIALYPFRGGGHKLVIGDGCVIRNCNFILEDRECGITIGHGTTVEGADFSAGDDSTSIEVGADCMFSRGIDIRTCDAHSIVQIDNGARINNSKSVHIGDHCWVAADVKILKGVVIESDSVIAAGAIVTHSVSRGCVVAGVPAHVIKSGVTWSRERV